MLHIYIIIIIIIIIIFNIKLYVIKKKQVKNKNPAPIQITAEQILLEAKERQEQVPKVPKQKITDKEELDDYRLKKRKTFEDVIRRNKGAINKWLQYASWEESQNEMERYFIINYNINE